MLVCKGAAGDRRPRPFHQIQPKIAAGTSNSQGINPANPRLVASGTGAIATGSGLGDVTALGEVTASGETVALGETAGEGAESALGAIVAISA